MQYLLVKNNGVANLANLTVLGLSSSRGDESKIGQFGTGAIQGINLLLRNNLEVVVFLGQKKVEFFLEDRDVDGSQFKQLCYRYNGEVNRLSISSEFGSLDWQDVGMAVREVVSNAIDNGNGNIGIKYVDTLTGEEGHTLVYIQEHESVRKFYREISRNFLHFSKNIKYNEYTHTLNTGETCLVYRKGVLVREIQKSSLFNYNFGEELKIDESRNLNDEQLTKSIAKYLSTNKEAMKDLLRATFAGKEFLENSISSYHFQWSSIVRKAFEELYPDTLIDNNAASASFAAAKGYKVLVISNANIYNLLTSVSVKTTNSVVSEFEKENKILEPSAILVKCVKKVWEKLEELELTSSKPMPKIKMFKRLMNGGTELMGEYKDGTIYINSNYVTNFQTILEECAHYITGSSDMSRDFQDFAFRVAVECMNLDV